MDTIEILRKLGFTSRVGSPDSVELDFGDFVLTAINGLNRRFIPAITIMGLYSTPRTVCEIDLELHPTRTNIDQAAAMIADAVVRATGRSYKPMRKIPWFEKALNESFLLPWNLEIARYAKRPRCDVKRQWMRLAVNELKEAVEMAEPAAHMIIEFDGKILCFTINETSIEVPASGNVWLERYEISIKRLGEFPRRFARILVEVSVVDEEFLQIGNYRYSGLVPSK